MIYKPFLQIHNTRLYTAPDKVEIFSWNQKKDCDWDSKDTRNKAIVSRHALTRCWENFSLLDRKKFAKAEKNERSMRKQIISVTDSAKCHRHFFFFMQWNESNLELHDIFFSYSVAQLQRRVVLLVAFRFHLMSPIAPHELEKISVIFFRPFTVFQK